MSSFKVNRPRKKKESDKKLSLKTRNRQKPIWLNLYIIEHVVILKL